MSKRHKLQNLAVILLSGASMVACSVDNKYDFSEDIDMTMGLGSEGLALKVGSTEKTLLKDILKTEDSNMLEIETTGTNLYYLIKDGSANVSVNVGGITPFKIGDVAINTAPFYTSPIGGTLPQDVAISPTDISGTNKMDLKISGIPSEVTSIKGIKFSNVNLTLSYNVYRNNTSVFNGVEVTGVDLKFKLPSYVYLNGGKHEYSTTKLGTITIPVDSIVLPNNDSEFGTIVNNGNIEILAQEVSVSGKIEAKIKKGTSVSPGDEASLNVKVAISPISPKTISGIMDPKINPTIDPINIKSDLPDFLNDDAVKLNVTNPTLRFDIAGTQLPIDLDFKAQLQGNENVNIPASGAISIPKKKNTTFYVFQGTTPYDPAGVATTSSKYEVSTLNTLITRIPEKIKIDVSGNKISTNKSNLHEINLPLNCNMDMKYKVLVPFKFGKDLCIVYNDSIEDMNKDLKDYDADGAEITATAENSIPLDLKVELKAYDINGKLIPTTELEITTATVNAAPIGGGTTNSDLAITLRPKKDGVISRIEKLLFKITAASKVDGEGQLTSDQYIKMLDLRFRLKGQIIANFN